ENLQQRGLAVPGRALDGQPLAILDNQAHAGQGVHRDPALLVALGHAGQLVHDSSPTHSTLDNAAAGRSRAARQPPNVPAIRPPAMASTTASTTAPMVTGAEVNHNVVRVRGGPAEEPARPA